MFLHHLHLCLWGTNHKMNLRRFNRIIKTEHIQALWGIKPFDVIDPMAFSLARHKEQMNMHKLEQDVQEEENH